MVGLVTDGVYRYPGLFRSSNLSYGGGTTAESIISNDVFILSYFREIYGRLHSAFGSMDTVW